MVMYKIDRRGGGAKNRILGNYQDFSDWILDQKF